MLLWKSKLRRQVPFPEMSFLNIESKALWSRNSNPNRTGTMELTKNIARMNKLTLLNFTNKSVKTLDSLVILVSLKLTNLPLQNLAHSICNKIKASKLPKIGIQLIKMASDQVEVLHLSLPQRMER